MNNYDKVIIIFDSVNLPATQREEFLAWHHKTLDTELERLEKELPEEENYLTAPGSTEKEIEVWNKAIYLLKDTIHKYREGLHEQ